LTRTLHLKHIFKFEIIPSNFDEDIEDKKFSKKLIESIWGRIDAEYE
jgi:hypothetical protein